MWEFARENPITVLVMFLGVCWCIATLGTSFFNAMAAEARKKK